MAKPPADLAIMALEPLDWSSAAAAASIEKLRVFVEHEAQSVNGWYMAKRSAKRRLGRLLRGLAILFGGLAAMVPIAQEAGAHLRPAYSPLFLAFAALFIAFDKFLGSTSSWIRYVQTSNLIVAIAHEFRAELEEHRSGFADAAPTPAQIAEAIRICRRYLAKIDRAVADETAAWCKEFREILKQGDDEAKRGESSQPSDDGASGARAATAVPSNAPPRPGPPEASRTLPGLTGKP